MTRPSANDLYKAAQIYLKQGQPVFPCRSQGPGAKAPMIERGLNAASLDREKVKRWWRRHSDAAIGIPTGIVWDVLDVDIKENADGRVHLPELERLGLLNGCKFVVRTPSGGWHLYFLAAPGLTNKASATLGLDVRAKGGYVIAPPSFIATPDYEGSYTFVGATEGSTDDPLRWDLIASALNPINAHTKQPVDLLPSERRSSLAALREWVSIRQPGERNNALHWAVCRCIESGLDPHELLDAALLSGLEEDEILLTIRSALRRAGVAAGDLSTEAEAMFGTD